MNCVCIKGCRKYPCVPVMWPAGQSLSRELCHHSPKQLQESSINDIITLVCLSVHMLVIGLHVFKRGHFQTETWYIFCFNTCPLDSELFMTLFGGCEQIKHKWSEILNLQRWGLIIKYKTCLTGTCPYARRQRSVTAWFQVWSTSCMCVVSVWCCLRLGDSATSCIIMSNYQLLQTFSLGDRNNIMPADNNTCVISNEQKM